MVTPRASLNIWLGVPVVLVLLTVWTSTDFPLDYWLHVNTGRSIWQHGHLVEVDLFSHTITGQPARNQPWLAQLGMYGLHVCGGYALNQWVAGICYAAALSTMLLLALRRARHAGIIALFGLLSFLLMAFNLGVRPQAFSFLLFALQLTWLLSLRRTAPLCLACLATEAVWVNAHGAFPLGIVVPAMLAAASWLQRPQLPAGPKTRRLMWATVAAACGALCNPHPAETWTYVLGVSTLSAQRGLEEWLPPSLSMTSGLALAVSCLAVANVLVRSRLRLRWDEVALITAFVGLAVGSQRMIGWWGMVLPLAIARPALGVRIPRLLWSTPSAARAERAKPLGWLDRCVAAAVVVWLVGCIPWSRPYNPLLPICKRSVRPGTEPYDLAQFLQGPLTAAPAAHGPQLDESHEPEFRSTMWENPRGPFDAQQTIRSCAPLRWGSYLSFATQGRLASFVDSRVDIFPDGVWRDFQIIRGGQPRALELLDQYRVQLVICDWTDCTLDQQLRHSVRWREIYADHLARVFVRQDFDL
jgi:hypothetical protein